MTKSKPIPKSSSPQFPMPPLHETRTVEYEKEHSIAFGETWSFHCPYCDQRVIYGKKPTEHECDRCGKTSKVVDPPPPPVEHVIYKEGDRVIVTVTSAPEIPKTLLDNFIRDLQVAIKQHGTVVDKIPKTPSLRRLLRDLVVRGKNRMKHKSRGR